jgi:hypothetical protein
VIEQPRRWHGPRGFALWALAGFLLAFTLLAGFSIGFLIAPFALLALAVAAQCAGRGGEAAGAILGTGAALVVVGLLNLDYNPCSQHGSERGTLVLDAGEEASCGGMNPLPWMLAGGVLAALSIALYRVVKRGRSPAPP